MDKYIDVMQSRSNQEYFDIHDRRIPELYDNDNCVLISSDGYLTPVPLATDDDYDLLIGG